MAMAMDAVLSLGGTCRCTRTPAATSPTPMATATGTTVTAASSQPPPFSTTTTMHFSLTSHSLASHSPHFLHFSVQAPRASTSSCSPSIALSSSSSRSCRQGISSSDRNSAFAITWGNLYYCGAHFGGREGRRAGGSRRRRPRDFFVTTTARRSSLGRRGGLLRPSDEMDCAMPQLRDTAPFRGVCQAPSRVRDARDSSSVPMAFFGFRKSKLPDVVQAGDPVLHEPAEEVKREDIGSARIEKTINDMVDVMRAGPGVGLAAPQIGVPLQIMVLEDTKELMSYTSPEECEAQQRAPFDLMVIINPKLEKKESGGTAFFFEGCLSVGGHRALVERHLEVEVRGVARDGQPVRLTATGWKARIVQHEFDHLQGLLYVDRMVKRSFRTTDNLRLPLPAGCPRPGPCSSPP